MTSFMAATMPSSWRLGAWLRRAYGADAQHVSGRRVLMVFSDGTRLAQTIINGVAGCADALVIVAPRQSRLLKMIRTQREAGLKVTYFRLDIGDTAGIVDLFDQTLAMHGSINAVLNLRCFSDVSSELSETAHVLPALEHALAVADGAMECLRNDGGSRFVDVCVLDRNHQPLAQNAQHFISAWLDDLQSRQPARKIALKSISWAIPQISWRCKWVRSRAIRGLIDHVITAIATTSTTPLRAKYLQNG